MFNPDDVVQCVNICPNDAREMPPLKYLGYYRVKAVHHYVTPRPSPLGPTNIELLIDGNLFHPARFERLTPASGSIFNDYLRT